MQTSLFSYKTIIWLIISSSITYEWCMNIKQIKNKNIDHNQPINTSLITETIIKKIIQTPPGNIQISNITCNHNQCYIQGTHSKNIKWQKLKKLLEIKSLNISCLHQSANKKTIHFNCQTTL